MTERERALFRRYRENGDLQARAELVERYMPYVRAIARRYPYRGEQLDDLVQIGAIGLINTIDRFDLTRGVELTTYATPTIIGEIKRHLRDRAWPVRVPRGLHELTVRLLSVNEQLSAELGRSPTISELAGAAGVTEEEVLSALEADIRYFQVVSLSYASTILEDGNPVDPLDLLGTTEVKYELSENRLLIKEALGLLDEREQTILRLYFFEDMTQRQIAMQVGISQMHVSRLITAALEKIRITIDGGGDDPASADVSRG